MAATRQTETRQERIARLKRQIRPGFSKLAARVTEDNREALDILEEYDRTHGNADGSPGGTANGKP